MGKFTTIMLEQLRTQGLSFLLLGIAVWFLHMQNQQLGKDVKACNEAVIEMYRTDRIEMINIVNQNTQALRELKKYRYER